MLKTFLKQWMPSSCKETVRQQIEIKPEWGEGLKHYLDTKLPKPDIKLGQIDAVAVDFETTGLNSEVDHILSIGMVPCTLEIVDAASSLEILVNHGQFIKPETALVNELTPEVLEGGVSLDDAMDTLFNAIAGKVVVAHGAWIEKSFIKSYLLKRYQQKDFPCYFLDTLNIEKKHSFRGSQGHHSSYQLDDLRAYYGLPEYLSHRAASDALACAELLMVQSKHLINIKTAKLEKFL